MKSIKLLSMAVAGAALLSSCGGATIPESARKDVSIYGITQGQVDSVSYAFGVSYGEMIKMYDMTELNMDQFTKGMIDAVSKAETGFESPNEINAAIQKYMVGKNNALAEYNKTTGEKFLEENKTKEGVQVTESGLQYKIEAAGSEVKAGPKDTVLVNYTGKLLDGSVFDSNVDAEEPVDIPLSRVIKGWAEGLQLIGEGGKIVLYIPSDLGYGLMARQPIGPNSTLVFDVEVVKVKPFVEKEKKEVAKELKIKK